MNVNKFRIAQMKSMQSVIKSLENRSPFKIIVDSKEIWKKMSNEDPAAGRGFVMAVAFGFPHQLPDASSFNVVLQVLRLDMVSVHYTLVNAAP
jgi:hypothetical protein